MAKAKQEAGAAKAADTQTKAGSGIHAPVKPSPELGEIVGADALPRSESRSIIRELRKNFFNAQILENFLLSL